MLLFCIETCRFSFTLPAAGCVFRRVGGGAYVPGHGQVRSSTAASSLPAEPVAAFVDWNTCCTSCLGVSYGGGGGGWVREAGGGAKTKTLHSQHGYTNLTQTPDGGQIHWSFCCCCPVCHQAWWFPSLIKSLGHDDETQQGAYLSLTQLQYKTVGNRQKHVKRAFCVHAHTGGIAFLGFIYIYIYIWEKHFFCVYLLLAVNNCVKIAFNEYSKVRCALGMQRECCDPFLHSVFMFGILFFPMCHVAGLVEKCLHMKTQRMMGDGDREATGLIDQRAFTRSRNVVSLSCGGSGAHQTAQSV